MLTMFLRKDGASYNLFPDVSELYWHQVLVFNQAFRILQDSPPSQPPYGNN